MPDQSEVRDEVQETTTEQPPPAAPAPYTPRVNKSCTCC